jgi:glycerophosphoryl diester phosphodiesterase
MKIVLTTTVFILLFMFVASAQTFDIQGHRGCRGLMPENSIPGFLKAMDIGVTTIEMDVVISADGKVVVSHDPYISAQFCVNELGIAINKKKEKEINIFRMDYEDVSHFDCGIIGNPDFPEQAKISVFKPLLTEVLDACEAHARNSGRQPVRYNIELKSTPSGDNIYNPEPELFTRLVYEAVKDMVPRERVMIQSFDARILQFWKMKYPDFKLSFLMAGSKSAAKVIEQLGFTPDIFSPHFKQVSQSVVDEWHQLSVKVVPWTVNDVADMKKIVALGVDGLITDYPDRYFDQVVGK